MHALGKHVLLDLRDCAPVLDDLEFLKEALRSAAQQLSTDILGESFYHFSPQGVSGVVLGTGSHICIHTWPEYGYAAVDIYACSDSFPSGKAAELLIEKLGAKESSITEVGRGECLG
ncbi:MAG: adenosylmethionine decarboxylase [Chloroflexi bacterium]|nr:MAG: adenosylmethionine decarboxylase [Chloroflexota bacterium]